MTQVVIRQARIEDAALLVQAEKAIAETPGKLVSRPFELQKERFIGTIQKTLDGKQGQYLVAEYHSEIVGHAILEILHLSSICHVAQLTLVVHSGWQKRGIGTKLLQELIQWARSSQHIEKIELNVRSSNAPAVALYKKLGFQEEGRLKNRIKVDEGIYIDDILMALFVK